MESHISVLIRGSLWLCNCVGKCQDIFVHSFCFAHPLDLESPFCSDIIIKNDLNLIMFS